MKLLRAANWLMGSLGCIGTATLCWFIDRPGFETAWLVCVAMWVVAVLVDEVTR